MKIYVSQPKINQATPNANTAYRLTMGMVALVLMQSACAQVAPGAGYAIKRLAGDNDVGSHFALASIPNGRTGFFYAADQQALYSGGCVGAKVACKGS